MRVLATYSKEKAESVRRSVSDGEQVARCQICPATYLLR
jgi:hypothetical protein